MRMIEAQPNKTKFIRHCIAKHSAETHELPKGFGEVIAAKRLMAESLPLFDISVVAGFPIPLDNDEQAEDVSLTEILCPHPDASYLIRVQGNSMQDADIHHGDLIMVDKSKRNPSPKEVAMCELNGEYTIKRIEKRREKLFLVPANPDYPEMEVKDEDDFYVWGVVTYVIHAPRKS